METLTLAELKGVGVNPENNKDLMVLVNVYEVASIEPDYVHPLEYSFITLKSGAKIHLGGTVKEITKQMQDMLHKLG